MFYLNIIIFFLRSIGESPHAAAPTGELPSKSHTLFKGEMRSGVNFIGVAGLYFVLRYINNLWIYFELY